MSICCGKQGELCCFAEPTERECIEARVVELEEALEKVCVYLTKYWGRFPVGSGKDTSELDEAVRSALAYEVI